MKKLLLVIGVLFLVGCGATKLNFKELEDVKYLELNKDNIDSVIVNRITNGGYDCYLVDKEKVYESFINITEMKEANISVTDDSTGYYFKFTDGNIITFSFEGPYLRYQNNNYKIKNFNKIKLLDEEKVECE